MNFTQNEKLKHGSRKTSIVVGAEPTGHYWFNLAPYLMEHEMKLVLVNPHHVKKSKEMDDNHPSKNDRKDPKTIAKLVCEGRYNVPYIPEGVYAELRIVMDSWLIISLNLTDALTE
jgi:transposase